MLGVGGIRKPESIGTVVFFKTDSEGIEKEIELENMLYIPGAPKNLISISQWSREQNGNCGVFSRGTYSISLWEKDKHQKLVPHPIYCRIPLMRVHEGALQRYRKFTDNYNTCLYDHTCLLANKVKAALPYWGLFRRPRHSPSVEPDGNQPDVDESEVAQQSIYDTSYPAGLTVKWKGH
eukprot:10831408-Ditylum_brightwellii.AAC.1